MKPTFVFVVEGRYFSNQSCNHNIAGVAKTEEQAKKIVAKWKREHPEADFYITKHIVED